MNFLHQLLFHDSTLTQGDRCSRKDCSENIIWPHREVDYVAAV